MGFKLVKTGNDHNRSADAVPDRQDSIRPGSIPRGYRIKYPAADSRSRELEELVETVRSKGYVLLWSSVLQDVIAFHGDETDRSKIPPGFVPYSQSELLELFDDQEPPLSAATLRLIHEAKKRGAYVIANE